MARCAGGGSGGRNAVAGSKLARDLDVFKDLKVACDLTFEVWLRPKVTRMNLFTLASLLR